MKSRALRRIGCAVCALLLLVPLTVLSDYIVNVLLLRNTSCGIEQKVLDCIEAGDYEGALEAADRLVALNGQWVALAYYRRAAVHAHLNDYDAAIRDLDQALCPSLAGCIDGTRYLIARGRCHEEAGAPNLAAEDFVAAHESLPPSHETDRDVHSPGNELPAQVLDSFWHKRHTVDTDFGLPKLNFDRRPSARENTEVRRQTTQEWLEPYLDLASRKGAPVQKRRQND